MRTTQFIGLTKEAEDFVKDLKSLPSDRKTFGMFGEDIPLRKWEIHPCLQGMNTSEETIQCIREVVQASPWSSGPMIFSCLEIDFGAECNCRIFEWSHNPLIDNEVDKEKGQFWV